MSNLHTGHEGSYLPTTTPTPSDYFFFLFFSFLFFLLFLLHPAGVREGRRGEGRKRRKEEDIPPKGGGRKSEKKKTALTKGRSVIPYIYIGNSEIDTDAKIPVQKKVSTFLKIYVDELKNEFRRKN